MFEEPRHLRTARGTACALSMLALLLGMPWHSTSHALGLIPSQGELEKYRRSWNPQTHGSLLIPFADTPRPGQLILQSFVFGQIGGGQYHNTLTTHVSAAPVNTSAAVPGGIVIYGLTDHVSIGGGLSGISWKSSQTVEGRDSATGVGDASLFLTYRTVVQDPETWRPSVGIYSRLSLPTSHWFGTHPIPGDFEPFSPRPSTRFGALSWTEGLLISKNLQPFRVSSAVYYTYNTPGDQFGGPGTAYAGDLLDARLSFEHVFHEDRGFGIIVGGLVRQGLPYRLDGHGLNVTPTNFSLVGVSVGLEYRFTPNWLAVGGVLYTVAGRNDLHALYPGFAIKYAWPDRRP